MLLINMSFNRTCGVSQLVPYDNYIIEYNNGGGIGHAESLPTWTGQFRGICQDGPYKGYYIFRVKSSDAGRNGKLEYFKFSEGWYVHKI